MYFINDFNIVVTIVHKTLNYKAPLTGFILMYSVNYT